MTTRYIVSIYMIDKRYGGPEEGGWWYNIGDLVRTMHVFGNEGAAYAYCNRLNDKLGTTLNKGRRPISSVLSTGRYAAKVHENHAPLHYPGSQPYYE